MAGFTDSITIKRPLIEVFEFATDLTNAPAWLQGVVKVERLDAPTGSPLCAGARFRETRMMGRREANAVIEVREHRGPTDGSPPYIHAAGGAAMGADAVYRYVFSDAGGGATRIDFVCIVRATRFIGRLMVPIMVAAMKKQDGRQLENLKAAMEDRSP